jgi:hypothetical protein
MLMPQLAQHLVLHFAPQSNASLGAYCKNRAQRRRSSSKPLAHHEKPVNLPQSS